MKKYYVMFMALSAGFGLWGIACLGGKFNEIEPQTKSSLKQ